MHKHVDTTTTTTTTVTTKETFSFLKERWRKMIIWPSDLDLTQINFSILQWSFNKLETRRDYRPIRYESSSSSIVNRFSLLLSLLSYIHGFFVCVCICVCVRLVVIVYKIDENNPDSNNKVVYIHKHTHTHYIKI